MKQRSFCVLWFINYAFLAVLNGYKTLLKLQQEKPWYLKAADVFGLTDGAEAFLARAAAMIAQVKRVLASALDLVYKPLVLATKWFDLAIKASAIGLVAWILWSTRKKGGR